MTQRGRILLGALFIIAGGLVLLDVLDILPGGTSAIWAALFIVTGVGFLSFYFQNKKSFWWAIIPSLACLGIGIMLVLNLIFPNVAGEFGAAILLLGIALGFWVVYFRDRSTWWPIIPAGVLTSLGVLIGLSAVLQDETFAGVFMIGIGLTFILVYFVQRGVENYRWALYPGAILIGIGLILMIATTTSWLMVLPALLIVGGAVMIIRVLRQKQTLP